ncbi:hypothetical protein H257_18289 [Aphanomyces astaci]|uniref:Mitochondrial carrier protein n=3 Tax=Aphanomyces astaci TaxID=112090 RepID=W4FDS9_APHAT|nr:hypothetical protein H257_18289 [Aphanomyces astaci]ETV64893.1 hypothetical protein H257_18289 [Aphanomyces astaci]RHY83902.1 hypothetical protein DYB35_006218 [Aphanomyces astaci]RHZ25461.1 hypothetical protein DYB37_003218 [Aphanomyces astaci]|eukprot:XP_009845621.1 hypothetical protein H257_18289 [Aphanomyces astaci]
MATTAASPYHVQTTTAAAAPPGVGVKFILAGCSNLSAAFITNPIDVLKTRMQLEGELPPHAPRRYGGFVAGGHTILRSEGWRGFYKGLTASLMRDGFYSGIRLGAYEPVKELLGATDPSTTPLYTKITAGAITGAFGSALANPTDLVKVRMQGEGTRYASTRQAFVDIWTHEGTRGLWKGVGPTVKRAALLTATQIPSYDHSKHLLINHDVLEEGVLLHFICSMFAGFMAATVTSPVDVIKTRIMHQSTQVYSGSVDAFQKIVRSEGIAGLYKGWFPNWMRLGPHTMITLMIFEELRKIAGLPPI